MQLSPRPQSLSTRQGILLALGHSLQGGVLFPYVNHSSAPGLSFLDRSNPIPPRKQTYFYITLGCFFKLLTFYPCIFTVFPVLTFACILGLWWRGGGDDESLCALATLWYSPMGRPDRPAVLMVVPVLCVVLSTHGMILSIGHEGRTLSWLLVTNSFPQL